MTINFYFGEGASHSPVPSDYKGAPFDSHELTPVKRFPLIDSVGLGDLVARITQQRESEGILFDELPVRGGVVRTHAHHLSPSVSYLFKRVAKAACFIG